MNSLAQFETERATRYIQTMCKHFSIKVKAEFREATGFVVFPFGRCDMTAHPDRLELRASAESEEQLKNVVDIITSHLERYAFRENPSLEWWAA